MAGTYIQEALDQVAQAIDHWGHSQVTVDPNDPTKMTFVMRSPNTSRTFVAEVTITDAREV